ncbi:MAG: hypothetical protein Q7S22_01450, partial [Candidatus Micrarchaeota archaeon]|nr:hypothetical protein [Candidatus Micrarchaeota archaeon]
VPLELVPEEVELLPDNQKRWLYRFAGSGVRPLVRGAFDDTRAIGAGFGYNGGCGVAAEATASGALGETVSIDLTIIRNGENELVVKGSREQIDAAARLVESLRK